MNHSLLKHQSKAIDQTPINQPPTFRRRPLFSLFPLFPLFPLHPLRLTRPPKPSLPPLIAAVLISMLICAPSWAGTTGAEFQTLYTTLLNWATGYLGKSIALAAFILGAGIGIARSSPIPALGGVIFALFMVYVPSIIDGIVTAVI